MSIRIAAVSVLTITFSLWAFLLISALAGCSGGNDTTVNATIHCTVEIMTEADLAAAQDGEQGEGEEVGDIEPIQQPDGSFMYRVEICTHVLSSEETTTTEVNTSVSGTVGG